MHPGEMREESIVTLLRRGLSCAGATKISSSSKRHSSPISFVGDDEGFELINPAPAGRGDHSWRSAGIGTGMSNTVAATPIPSSQLSGGTVPT